MDGMDEVWHGRSPAARPRRKNGGVRGGTVSTETLLVDDEVVELGETEELLVEEVAIDGLCGVY
jgi:mycofactocin precursor